jgi:hypothetical protein
MDRGLQQLVRERAGDRCEYCHFPQWAHPQRLPIDHVVPRKHNGTDDESNLALSCPLCNLHKGSNLTGLDPADGTVQRLYHPRRDNWTDHFHWRGAIPHARTATGRVTIQVLNMNDARRVKTRELLIAQGLLP